MIPSISDLISIVHRAASLMRERNFKIKEKCGFSNIVTSSDIAVQEYLCPRLAELLPGCGFICEEEDYLDPDHEMVWIIDPIDGTTNYSRGIDNCCISVGLFRRADCQPLLGVVYSPNREETYSAEYGKGAFLNGKPIHVSNRPVGNSLIAFGAGVYSKQNSAQCLAILQEMFLKCNDYRRFGSAAMELCFLAKGDIDLYFEPRLLPWDFAASILILREAGGCMANLDGEQPRISGPDIACAANGEENLQILLEAVRRQFSCRPDY